MLLALLALALIAAVLATPMIVRETGRRRARPRALACSAVDSSSAAATRPSARRARST